MPSEPLPFSAADKTRKSNISRSDIKMSHLSYDIHTVEHKELGICNSESATDISLENCVDTMCILSSVVLTLS